MELLFVPEFAPQQFSRIIGDLSQPLFQRLVAFTVDDIGGGPQGRLGGLFVAQLAAGYLVAAGMIARLAGLGVRRLVAGRWVLFLGRGLRRGSAGRIRPGRSRLRGVLFVAGCGGVGGLAWLSRWLGLFFPEQLFHQCPVLQGWSQVRLTFQGLFVGVQRRFQLAAAGQGVAPIVVGVGIVAFGKLLRGGGVVAGFIEGQALPLRVLEMLCGFDRALLLKQLLALLVWPQP